MKIIGGENSNKYSSRSSCQALVKNKSFQTTHISLSEIKRRQNLVRFNNAFNCVPLDIFIKEQRLGFKLKCFHMVLGKLEALTESNKAMLGVLDPLQ